MKTRALLATAALVAVTALPMASAHAGTKLGLLSCQSDGTLSYVVGSSKEYLCVFKPADGSGREAYIGTLDTVGVDVGITGRQDLSWIVYAASFQEGEPRSLDGNYYGATVDASVAVGAKALVGGPNNGFTLQSVSLQAQFGLNATAGLSRFSLQAAPTEPAVYKP
jgi:hypothetical protein